MDPVDLAHDDTGDGPVVVLIHGHPFNRGMWAPQLAALRGRPHDVGGRAVWATYHPSAAIRFGPNGAPRAGLAADLAAVAESLA